MVLVLRSLELTGNDLDVNVETSVVTTCYYLRLLLSRLLSCDLSVLKVVVGERLFSGDSFNIMPLQDRLTIGDADLRSEHFKKRSSMSFCQSIM